MIPHESSYLTNNTRYALARDNNGESSFLNRIK